LKKHKALTTASYLPKKKQKVYEAVPEKFESMCGSTSSQASSSATEELKGNGILEKWFKQVKNATKHLCSKSCKIMSESDLRFFEQKPSL